MQTSYDFLCFGISFDHQIHISPSVSFGEQLCQVLEKIPKGPDENGKDREPENTVGLVTPVLGTKT